MTQAVSTTTVPVVRTSPQQHESSKGHTSIYIFILYEAKVNKSKHRIDNSSKKPTCKNTSQTCRNKDTSTRQNMCLLDTPTRMCHAGFFWRFLSSNTDNSNNGSTWLACTDTIAVVTACQSRKGPKTRIITLTTTLLTAALYPRPDP